MSLYPFHALLGRMKYITRWALMRCMRQESLSEHTADTALLAHALCLIARNITHTGADIRPDTVAAAALYHDAPEILTGDMPTPVKYKNEALRTAYKAVERESALAMADLLPPELPELGGLPIVSAGFAVAELCKNRLEPCHAAFMAARAADCRRLVNLTRDDPRVTAFLRGEQIEAPDDLKGWTAVAVEGITLGFGKVSGGTLKNRYPKGLRLLAR